MARRRRNKVVIWDWSPDGKHTEPNRNGRRTRTVGREALGAAVLLGIIIFFLSRILTSTDGDYRRDRLAGYLCEMVGTDPDAPRCVAVAVGGWFIIVVTFGIILQVGRGALKSFGRGRDA